MVLDCIFGFDFGGIGFGFNAFDFGVDGGDMLIFGGNCVCFDFGFDFDDGIPLNLKLNPW